MMNFGDPLFHRHVTGSVISLETAVSFQVVCLAEHLIVHVFDFSDRNMGACRASTG